MFLGKLLFIFLFLGGVETKVAIVFCSVRIKEFLNEEVILGGIVPEDSI
jgi:hypothetical protein